MSYKYYGSAQFQQMQEQRDHDDKFITEIIRLGSSFNKDIGEFMVDDILQGNTHTITSHYKKGTKETIYETTLLDGVSIGEHGSFIEDHTLYGQIPVKNDYSTFNGYESYAELPDDDYRKKRTNDALKTLNMDWEEITKKIVKPDDIGPIYNEKGDVTKDFLPYYKNWKNSDSLQEKYPTIESYHASLTDDLTEQRRSIPDISDIFIGMAVTGETFGIANVVALYFTLGDKILPFLTKHKKSQDGYEGFPPLTYSFEYGSGYFEGTHLPDFITVCGCSGFTHVIRNGIVKNEFDDGEPKWKKLKSNWEMYRPTDINTVGEKDPDSPIFENKNIHYTETIPSLDEGDSIAETLYNNEDTDASSVIIIQVQLTVDTYGEIRLYDYGTSHALTGNSGKLSIITGTVFGNENDIPDNPNQKTNFGLPLVWFPLSYKACKEVPFFQRERLLRETVLLSIYAQKKIKVKWYQKGWFKVVLFIVSIILAIVTGPGGFAALASFQTIVTTAFELAIINIVAYVVMNMIDNPVLLLVLMVIISAYNFQTGFTFDTSGLFDSAIALVTKVMNAAGMAINKYYQNKLEELKEEIEEFKHDAAYAENQLEQLIEEAGGIIRSDYSDLTTYLASLAPNEGVENFFGRTLDSGFAIINSIDDQVDVEMMFPDMLRV